ncbi:hypothetical protein CL617_03435 [archaeon]|nr:hypothetical protein [archaeon]|tara:strand:+ start:5844 stop:6557 length:714 start_codon:yes stop_codon:yes gene_type:complete
MSNYPKILVGCPTSFHKEYALAEYVKGLKAIDYPNFDILIVDNSKDEYYFNKIKEKNVPVIKGPYYKNARDRIIVSRNILREKAINENYDYFFSLEQDVIPPKDALLNLVKHDKKMISCIYFLHNIFENRRELTPQAFLSLKTEEKGILPSMRPLNDYELDSNKLIKIVSCGLGCVLIHKSILEEIEFRYDKETEAFDDRFMCIDLYNKDIKIYCDTSIKCKHLILSRPYPWNEIKK